MWEPDQYDGVDRLLVPGDMIWRPDLSIYNQIEYGQGSGEGTIFNNPYQVVINNEGIFSKRKKLSKSKRLFSISGVFIK